jgi:hypothetical protein
MSLRPDKLAHPGLAQARRQRGTHGCAQLLQALQVVQHVEQRVPLAAAQLMDAVAVVLNRLGAALPHVFWHRLLPGLWLIVLGGRHQCHIAPRIQLLPHFNGCLRKLLQQDRPDACLLLLLLLGQPLLLAAAATAAALRVWAGRGVQARQGFEQGDFGGKGCAASHACEPRGESSQGAEPGDVELSCTALGSNQRPLRCQVQG